MLGILGMLGFSSGVMGYIQYGLLALTLVNVIKRLSETGSAKVDPMVLMNTMPYAHEMTFSQRISHLLLSGPLERKGLSVADLRKTRERRSYENDLNITLSPFDTYIWHEEPTNTYTTIKSSYLVNGMETEFYDENVYTKEYILYYNSIQPAQIYSPAWNTTDKVNLEYYISSNSSFQREDFEQGKRELKGTLNSISLVDPDVFERYFQFEISGENSVWVHFYISKSDCDLEDSERCEIVGRKSIEISYQHSRDDKNSTSEREQTYLDSDNSIILAPLDGVKNRFETPPYILDSLCLDLSGKRDKSTGIVQRYFPTIFKNPLWQSSAEPVELLKDTKSVTVKLSFEVPPSLKLKAYKTAQSVKYGYQKYVQNNLPFLDGL